MKEVVDRLFIIYVRAFERQDWKKEKDYFQFLYSIVKNNPTDTFIEKVAGWFCTKARNFPDYALYLYGNAVKIYGLSKRYYVSAADCYEKIAECYMSTLKDYASAIKYYETAAKIYQSLEYHKEDAADCYEKTAEIYLTMGVKLSAYSSLNNACIIYSQLNRSKKAEEIKRKMEIVLDKFAPPYMPRSASFIDEVNEMDLLSTSLRTSRLSF